MSCSSDQQSAEAPAPLLVAAIEKVRRDSRLPIVSEEDATFGLDNNLASESRRPFQDLAERCLRLEKSIVIGQIKEVYSVVVRCVHRLSCGAQCFTTVTSTSMIAICQFTHGRLSTYERVHAAFPMDLTQRRTPICRFSESRDKGRGTAGVLKRGGEPNIFKTMRGLPAGCLALGRDGRFRLEPGTRSGVGQT